MYKIALYGTNVYRALNTNSAVSISNLTSEAGDPREPNSAGNLWKYYDVGALDPETPQLSEPKERMGGVVVQSKGLKKTFEIMFPPWDFPTDYMGKYFDLMNLLNKRQVYLYVYDYEDTANVLHGAAEALCVAATCKVEHDHEHGAKQLTLSVRAVKPI